MQKEIKIKKIKFMNNKKWNYSKIIKEIKKNGYFVFKNYHIPKYFELGFECYVLILQILILIGLLEQPAAQLFDFADIFHISLYGFL